MTATKPTIHVCPRCGSEKDHVEVCARCRGRGWITKSEHGGNSSNNTGFASMWNEPCPDCVRGKVR